MDGFFGGFMYSFIRKSILLLLVASLATSQVAHAGSSSWFSWKTLGVTTALIAGYLWYSKNASYARYSEEFKAHKITYTPKQAEQKNAPAEPYTTIFCHGFGGGPGHSQEYAHKESGFIEGKYVDFAFKDYDAEHRTTLAQDDDIYSLHAVCKTITKDSNIILVGVSRGASTIVNYLAWLELNKTHSEIANILPRIKAAVLEAPFDKVQSVIENKLGIFNNIPGLSSLIHRLMPYFGFPMYDPCRIQPIEAAKYLPKDIPLLFIYSHQDTLIPAWSTVNLFRMIPHQNFQGYQASGGCHCGILGTDAAYSSVVHAFYKAHSLPCNEAKAAAGKAKFETGNWGSLDLPNPHVNAR